VLVLASGGCVGSSGPVTRSAPAPQRPTPATATTAPGEMSLTQRTEGPPAPSSRQPAQPQPPSVASAASRAFRRTVARRCEQALAGVLPDDAVPRPRIAAPSPGAATGAPRAVAPAAGSRVLSTAQSARRFAVVRRVVAILEAAPTPARLRPLLRRLVVALKRARLLQLAGSREGASGQRRVGDAIEREAVSLGRALGVDACVEPALAQPHAP
jgi:hypothetical protein